MFPLTRRNAYLTQENVKITRHFRPSCVPGTHEKINWHVVKGDGEKTGDKTSHLAHGQCALKYFSFTWHVGERPMFIVFGGHCH